MRFSSTSRKTRCIIVTIKNPLEIWYFYKIRCGIVSRLLFCCAHLNSVWVERSSRANPALLQPVCAHQEDCSRLQHTGETGRPRKKDDDLTAFQGWGCFLLHRCEIVWSGEDASFFCIRQSAPVHVNLHRLEVQLEWNLCGCCFWHWLCEATQFEIKEIQIYIV